MKAYEGHDRWSEIPISDLLDLIKREKAEIAIKKRDLALMERILGERLPLEKIISHPFKPSLGYPDGEGCAHIIRDYPNSTLADPDCCRQPEFMHAESLRNKIKGE